MQRLRFNKELFRMHPMTILLIYISTLVLIFSTDNIYSIIAILILFYFVLEKDIRRKMIPGVIVMGLFITIINPLFNHTGKTVLFYLAKKPITLEALNMGVILGIKIMATIIVFSKFNKDFTPREWIYVIGKVTPHLAIVLTIAFQKTEYFKGELKKVVDSLRMYGYSLEKGNLKSRFKCGIEILRHFMALELEEGIILAQSMKSRGYGIGKRSSFLKYKFKIKDYVYIAISIILILIMAFNKINLIIVCLWLCIIQIGREL